MPPPDVGSLISCDGVAELTAHCRCDTELSGPDADDPYAPAESLRLRIGEDIDWGDVVAVAVLERDDSTKGAGANPKRAARRSVAATAARSSLSAKAPAPRAVAVVIGGLPVAACKAARDHARRRSPCQQLQLVGARVFASGEDAEHQLEPGSPKVSCLGGVRSQPRTAAEGITITSGGRRRWAWLVADVMFCRSNWNGRHHRRPRGSEAE